MTESTTFDAEEELQELTRVPCADDRRRHIEIRHCCSVKLEADCHDCGDWRPALVPSSTLHTYVHGLLYTVGLDDTCNAVYR